MKVFLSATVRAWQRGTMITIIGVIVLLYARAFVTILDPARAWDSFFYCMAKFGASGNVDDFGEATRHYKAVELGLSEINRMLGVAPIRKEETPIYEEPSQPKPEGPAPVREKEIIREKEVIVKIRCRYCSGVYDETLDECPHCGGRR